MSHLFPLVQQFAHLIEQFIAAYQRLSERIAPQRRGLGGAVVPRSAPGGILYAMQRKGKGGCYGAEHFAV
jgi:hypothetical protein